MDEGHDTVVSEACPNCDTILIGRWCHACGQELVNRHQSLLQLALEASEGLTHADGRLWTTIRRLALVPGELTRDYLVGRRIPQLPPFRVFLIGVVLLLLAGPIGNLGPNKTHIQFADPYSSRPRGILIETSGLTGAATPIAHWINKHMSAASKNPERAVNEMERWVHYAAVLTILVASPLLALAFARDGRFYFYDHLIFSMHSLAFQAALLSAALVLGGWFRAAWLLLLLAPVHLFLHMRGAYRTTIIGTLARMIFLFIGSLIGFTLLFTMLVVVGLAAETST